MELTDEEFMRRRDFIATALAGLGLELAVPVIDRAAWLDWSAVDAERDGIVAAHGAYFDALPAGDHLPLLARDFVHVDTRSRVYLAAMIGESLSVLGHTGAAARWFTWANEHHQTPGQAAWLHGRNAYLALDADRPELVRPSQDATGLANYAKAQARLGNARAATDALDRAGRATSSEGGLSIFSFPASDYHQAGSVVHTRVGNPGAAADHQRAALASLPARATLPRALLNIDIAARLATAGDGEAARDQLAETLATLPTGHRYGVITRRASEVYKSLPA